LPVGEEVDATDAESPTPFESGKVVVFRPRHLSPRIIAQASIFTVHPVISGPPELIRMENDPAIRDRLTKYEIPSRCFELLRFQLNRIGINAGSMSPDLDGHAERIRCDNYRFTEEM
jgi:hypothetical protein